MKILQVIARYFSQLSPGKLVLWCYLTWYLTTVALYFDPALSIWLNALGISAIVGAALLLSIKRGPSTDRWQVFRLFMMPFGVSSFSALIKGQGFFLVFSPDARQLLLQVGSCILFLAAVLTLKTVAARMPSAAP